MFQYFFATSLHLLLGFNSSSDVFNQTTSYTELLASITQQRNLFQDQYRKSDREKQDSIISIARDYLLQTTTEKIFPYWYGTPWDFNGITRIPGEGKIACGYFVNNVISDLGFNIPRVRWSQSASEVFISALAERQVKRFSGSSVSKVEDYLKQEGEGLYLVGLDIHVGFVLLKNGKSQFIHSSNYQPDIGVLSEDLDSGNPFSDSNYRVLGRLFSDEMVRKWLVNEAY